MRILFVHHNSAICTGNFTSHVYRIRDKSMWNREMSFGGVP